MGVALGCLAVGSAACADRPPVSEITVALQEVRRFGANESAATEDERQRAFAGALLADVAALSSDSAGMLYVLDRDLKKIAIFDRDGAFRGVVVGGAGEGPGEFSLPIHLTSGGAARLSVLDYELRRVTWFENGAVDRIVRLSGPSPWRHAVSADTIFVTPHQDASAPAATFYGADGRVLGAAPQLPEPERPFGPPAGITILPERSILISTRRPGVWLERRDGAWRRVGTPLFPEMAPPHEEVTGPRTSRVTPAQATANSIAGLDSGLVLQGHVALPRPFDWDDPPGRDEVNHMIATFSADGRHLGTVHLPRGTTADCMISSPRPRHVFLCTTEPFPQVVEYRVDVGTSGR